MLLAERLSDVPEHAGATHRSDAARRLPARSSCSGDDGNVQTVISGNRGNDLTASNSDWRLDWAAGSGVEYALACNWSLRAEYMHIDLGRGDFSGVALDTNTYAWRDRLPDNVLRLGVNYRF
jgi:opacity protein-like surface antigen